MSIANNVLHQYISIYMLHSVLRKTVSPVGQVTNFSKLILEHLFFIFSGGGPPEPSFGLTILKVLVAGFLGGAQLD